ncbi:hypothetical protein [Prevotella intermedia]|uniref:Uncharacterized protein n=1 Tax=Prevotella intermedia TaxID=28131 RepID=A0A0T7APE9_PREIN|nr:hypothetical protein [Prevotella intermedia]AWX07944.1 hypothetical protein CTM55_09525 [Prevotella intermedia]BAU18958.1 conserved hypothetical protein [Prevotella intermedia]
MKQLLLLSLLLLCTPALAQSPTTAERQHLTFCGISLNNTAAAFADSLVAKGFKPETAPLRLPINKANATFRGRFENIPCIVEVGQNHIEKVDTLRIYLLNVNNPLRSYKILTNFYRSHYGAPIFENYYDMHLLPREAQQQLAADPFITTFSVDGGTVQFSLKYDAQLYNYIYSLLFIDIGNTLPILSNDDSVIEW